MSSYDRDANEASQNKQIQWYRQEHTAILRYPG